MTDKAAFAEFVAFAREFGTRATSAAYGIPLRTVQRSVKSGIMPDKWADAIGEGPTVAAVDTGKGYRARGSASTSEPTPTPISLEEKAAREADERPLRSIIEDQKEAAKEITASVFDGVLCVTETTLKASGVEFRPIRTATFAELNQAVANAHETVLRGNQGVPYAVVLGSNGRYYGVILGSNTDPGAIYDDEGYQALLEFANTGEAPSGWEDTGDWEEEIDDD